MRLLDFMRQADEPGLINLAAGVPGLDALPAADLEKAFSRAFDKDGAQAFAYHHPEGDHELRRLLAERLNGRGAAIMGEQIVTVTGCTQALQLMLSLLVQPGDVVACEAPAYYGLLELLSAAGARVLPLPVRNEDGIDVDEAAELLRAHRPKCAVICTALSNPSGATMPTPNRERFVTICRELGIRIIEDDIYGELLDAGGPTPMLTWDDGTTVSYVSSFSKSVSPGLRVGLCVPGSLREEFAALKCRQDLHSAVMTEAALREFILADKLDPHLERLRERNRRRREIGLEAVRSSFPADTEFTAPAGGYMLWVRLPMALDLAALKVKAREQRVVFASGDVFFCEKQPQSSLRLNCAKADEDELVQGIEILGRLISTM